MKFTRLAAFLFSVSLAFSTFALAQANQGSAEARRFRCGQGGGAAAGRMYDPKTVETVAGEVLRTDFDEALADGVVFDTRFARDAQKTRLKLSEEVDVPGQNAELAQGARQHHFMAGSGQLLAERSYQYDVQFA